MARVLALLTFVVLSAVCRAASVALFRSTLDATDPAAAPGHAATPGVAVGVAAGSALPAVGAGSGGGRLTSASGLAASSCGSGRHPARPGTKPRPAAVTSNRRLARIQPSYTTAAHPAKPLLLPAGAKPPAARGSRQGAGCARSAYSGLAGGRKGSSRSFR